MTISLTVTGLRGKPVPLQVSAENPQPAKARALQDTDGRAGRDAATPALRGGCCMWSHESRLYTRAIRRGREKGCRTRSIRG